MKIFLIVVGCILLYFTVGSVCLAAIDFHNERVRSYEDKWFYYSDWDLDNDDVCRGITVVFWPFFLTIMFIYWMYTGMSKAIVRGAVTIFVLIKYSIKGLIFGEGSKYHVDKDTEQKDDSEQR